MEEAETEEKFTVQLLRWGGLFMLLLGSMCLFVLATWDRIEPLVPSLVIIAAGFTVSAMSQFAIGKAGPHWLDIFVIVGVSYFSWRAWNSPVRLYGITDLILVLLAGGFWFSRATISTIQGRRIWVILLFVLCIGHILASWYQCNIDPDWGMFVKRSEQAKMKASGLFPHYNYMANFAVMGILCALAVLLLGREKLLLRAIAGLSLVGYLIVFSCTVSRGGMMGLAVGIVLFVFLIILRLSSHGKKNAGLYACLSITGMVVCLIALAVGFAKVKDTRGYDDAFKDNGRSKFAEIAFDQIFQSPIIGHGARSFEWKSIELWPENLWQGSGTLNYVHNEFLQLAGDYGFVGVAIVVAFLLGWVVVQIYHIIIDQGSLRDHAWRIAGICCLGAFLAQSNFSFLAHIPANLCMLIIILCLSWHSDVGCKSRAACWGARMVQICLLIGVALVFVRIALKERLAFEHYLIVNETYEVDYRIHLPLVDREIEATREILAVSQNFKRWEHLSQLYWIKFENTSGEEQVAYLRKAGDAKKNAAEMYPFSPVFKVGLGLIYSRLGEYEFAEENFKFAAEYGARREYWIHANRHYGEYCYYRGHELWNERKTSQALQYFKDAQKYLKRAKVHGKHWRAVMMDLETKIKLLEDAGF